MFKKITAIALVVTASVTSFYSNKQPEIMSNGWISWHSYSTYDALDSELFVHAPDGEIVKIEGSFINPMNAHFGSHPFDIIFMAIDKAADEWDIYRYNSMTGLLTNYTENSGFRNEDPKFSPDGMRVVFKRGYWSNEINNFVYNLAELDLQTKEVTMLTDDIFEEAMPYYSSDGNKIYYTMYKDGYSSINCLDRQTGDISCVYIENGVVSYYPIMGETALYFTKWYSSENHCDQIIRFTDKAESMPFNSNHFDCSDPFPIGEDKLIYCHDADGNYDLYYYDAQDSIPLSLFNTDKNELGAVYYSDNRLTELMHNTSDFLLGADTGINNYDIDSSGDVDCFDLVMQRRAYCDLYN